MHPCLIRRGCVHLRLSFQGAVYKDQTIFHKAVEAALNPGSSLSRNVDIIAQPFPMLPAGLELKEKLVLLQAACQTLALKRYWLTAFRLPGVSDFALSSWEYHHHLCVLCIFFPIRNRSSASMTYI